MKKRLLNLFYQNTGKYNIIDHNPNTGESLIRFVDTGK